MTATQVTFDELIQKVLHDVEFRKALIKDPRRSLESIGVDATDEMIEALEEVDYASITRVAETFGRNESIHPDSALC